MVYQISKDTLDKVLDALRWHWFSEDGESNNDDVVEASRLLEDEIAKQEVT